MDNKKFILLKKILFIIFFISYPLININSSDLKSLKFKKRSLIDQIGKKNNPDSNNKEKIESEQSNKIEQNNENKNKSKIESLDNKDKTQNLDNENNSKKIHRSSNNQTEENSENKKFQLNFENAALKNVLDYIENIFDVKFFSDDAIGDERKIKGVSEVKISFKSNKSLTENQIWNFLDLILENSGLARIHMPGQDLNFYRITQIATANKSNIHTYIGTNLDELPDYERIRYMYFVQNRQANQLKDLLNRLQSKNAQVEIYQDLNVLIITDVAYNIKTLMKIIKELDSSGLPEILSVLKLKSADATDVARLYETLKGKEDIFRPFGEPKKAGPRLIENTKIIAEPRTNALIIFGPKESVQRLEDFIKKHVDKELEVQATKIHVYELSYAPADQIANLLNAVTQFGAESEAARLGGVRSGEKYLSRMYFEAEKQGNRLIIRSETEEDYKIIKKVIEEIDVPQPQVAIEVFILSITLTDIRAIQSQLRNKENETLNFQTSGFFGNKVQVNTTNNSGSLITNLINLATSATQGTTVFTLGKASVWAILGILQSITDTKIIANPFLVATNKYTATVSLGETRRIQTGTILGTGTGSQGTAEFGQVDANLSLSITPQINDYGIVNLDIDVTIDNFTGSIIPTAPTAGDKTTRRIHTNANVADQEVLALGGLIRDRITVVQSGVPILSQIPLIGLLFTNKRNEIRKDNLVIFMSPRIIKPHKELISPYTLNKAERIKLMMADIDSRTNKRDPVYKWFFKEPIDLDNRTLDKFILPSEQKNRNLKYKNIRVDKIDKDDINKNNVETKSNEEKIINKIPAKIINPKRSLLDCVRIKKEDALC